ncbi:MAG TPA: hypothetical protein DCM45_02405 [Clostridiales bacterium]|nr:hypothetical protein [Clostridiales bacterium]
MLEIVLTAATAIAGGFIGKRLRLPAGFMLGALLATGLLNILWPAAAFPADARVIAQIIAGAYIGMTVTRKSLQELRQMLLPSLVLFTGISIIALLSGFAVFWLSDLALTTAFLATVPGGIVDMSMISLEFGAQPQIVAALQLERLVLIMSVYPFIFKKIIARQRSLQGVNDKVCQAEATISDPVKPEATVKRSNPCWHQHVITLLSASIAGLVFYLLGVPAGAMVGAMIAVALYNILSNGQAFVAPPLKSAAQVAAGLLIGMTIDSRSLSELSGIALPALIVLLECVAIGGIMGWILWKVLRVDLATALFGSAPAGLSDMVLIALDEGGDPAKVMLLQLVRFIGVISLFPSLIKLIATLIS